MLGKLADLAFAVAALDNNSAFCSLLVVHPLIRESQF